MWREALFGCVLTITLSGVAPAQEAHQEWVHFQEVSVPGPGLYRIKLSVEGLSVTQRSLADLRILDPSGQELPFLLDHPAAIPPQEVPLQAVRVTMERDRTVMTGETPSPFTSRWFRALTIHSPAPKFLKPVTVEASQDGESWVMLAQNHPIHRQEGHPSQPRIPLPRGRWTHWRITLDDTLTLPLPVDRLAVSAEGEPPPSLDRATVQVVGSATDGRQRDLTLLFPAAHLMATAFRLETRQPASPRKATLLTRVYRQGAIQEEAVATGTLQRVPSELPGGDEQLALNLSTRIPSRKLVLRVAVEDGPPMEIARILVEVVPTYAVFRAQAEGSHRLLLGNPKAEERIYDVSRLKEEARQTGAPILSPGSLQENPGASRPTPARTEGVEEGASLDLSAWAFRKKITVTRAGIHRLKLDPEVLASHENRISDLRILRGGKQVPYLIEYTGLGQGFEPRVEAGRDHPRTSRWVFILPGKGFPVTHLSCNTTTPAFLREVRLVEETKGNRGETIRVHLGKATWSRRPGQDPTDLTVILSRTPETDRLILEMDNGDNPPLPPDGFRFFYTAPKLLFRASPETEMFLYYGNPAATTPRYEVAMLGPELAAADPLEASLSSQESLRPGPRWGVALPSGVWQYGFWIVIGVVVLVLLAVIRKLLPSQAEDPKQNGGGAVPPAGT